MKRTVLALGAVCVLLWGAGAFAAVTITDVQWNPGATCNVSLYANADGTNFVEATNTFYGGEMTYSNWVATSPDSPTIQLSNALFCIEIPESFTPGSNLTYGDNTNAGLVNLQNAPKDNGGLLPAVTPMGSLAASLIENLWYQDRSLIVDANSLSAFQLALWKLEYDGSAWVSGSTDNSATDFTMGRLRADTSNPVAQLAATWISNLNPTGPQANLMALAWPGPQDFVGAVTPEPASLIVWSVLGAGAVGMALRRRGSGGRWSAGNRQAIHAVIGSKLHA